MNRREMIQKSTLFGMAAISVPAFGSLSFVGCTEQQTADWIQLGLNLVGTVIPTLPGILGAIGALTGKSIPDTVATTLNDQFTNVQNLFKTIQADIKQFQASNDQTIIGKIQLLIQQIQKDLSAVLADLSIKDAGTVTHIKAVVSSLSLLASNLLAILPIITSVGKIQARKVDMKRYDARVWAKQFNDTVQQKTDNSEADAAFAGVKAEPKG